MAYGLLIDIGDYPRARAYLSSLQPVEDGWKGLYFLQMKKDGRVVFWERVIRL